MDAQSVMLTEFETLKKDRNYPAALELILKLVQEGKPVSRQYLAEAAALYKSMRRYSEAADWFKRAIEAGDNNRGLYFEHAVCLMEAGKLKEAEAEINRFLKKQPKDFVFNHILGVVFKKQHRYPEAIKKLLQVCAMEPQNPDPYRNLGNAYNEMGDNKAAEDMYKKTAAIQPGNAENWRLIGYTQVLQKKYAEAVESYRKSLQVNPHHDGVFVDMTGTLCNMRLFDEAQKEIGERQARFPDDAQVFTAKAWLLKFQGKMPEAIEALSKALALKPDRVNDLLTMARFLESSDRQKANEFLRRAVAASNRSLRTLSRLCNSLNRSRYGSEAAHIQEGYEIGCEMVSRFPRNSLISEADTPRDLFLRCIDYARIDTLPDNATLMRHWVDEGRIEPFWISLGRVKTLQDRLDIVEYHREWGGKIEAHAAETPIKRTEYKPSASALAPVKSKIRLGIMSSDLRDHPVSYFALPLFENYDRSRFEIYCYSFYGGKEDNLQKKISGEVTAFRWWPHKQNFDVAQGIADDHLDILFELGGPTDMNKVQVMAYKPAPVQGSWLGYPHSIGFSAIDYILVDPYLKPEDPRLLIEKPFEVLETTVALGRVRFHDHPPITPEIPQNRNGGLLTFGTMNNPNKYTPEVIATWAEVMTQVPNSRFLFVRPEGDVPAFKANMAREFAKHGITENRLAYIAIRGQNMPHYNEIDISLDTFPHVGGTTTCETLWMGVPLVTLVGPAFYERTSYSHLNNAGLGDLCAFTRDEYIAKAIALAADKKRREMLRVNMREQIRARPLGQTERFAENFYKKIESVLK
jgi:predicted O-linked N-acetylglucosamine transferase (SPINDLY family)